jgi:Neuraminidase (sialidase)
MDDTPGNWEIIYSKSSNGGVTWSAAANVSNTDGSSAEATIAADVGAIHVAWSDDTPGNQEILYSKSTDGGATWSVPVNVSNNSGGSVNSVIMVDAGTVHLAWEDNTAGNWEIFYSKSTDGGATWSAPVNVSNNSGDSEGTKIAVNAGTIYLAWYDYTPANVEIFFSKSTDGGVTWSAPVNVSNNDGGSYGPAIVADAGTIHVAWWDNTPGNAEIFYSNSTDGGATWSAPVNVSNNSVGSVGPTIAVDSGTIHLAWGDDTPGNPEIFYSNSTDGGTTWSAAVNVSNNIGASYVPLIAVYAGNVYLAWYDDTPGNSEIFYAGPEVSIVGSVGGGTGYAVPEANLEAIALIFLAAVTIVVAVKRQGGKKDKNKT